MDGKYFKLRRTIPMKIQRIKLPLKPKPKESKKGEWRTVWDNNKWNLVSYLPEDIFEIKHPEMIHLPKSNISSRYIFATSDDFLIYPNNYNQMVNFYRNTFQHGGISMEEMIIPLVILNPQ